MQKIARDVSLRIATEQDYPLLERWLQQSDIFAFLDYEEPPNRFEIKTVVLAKLVDILIIQHKDKAVGFFLVYTRGMKRTNSREFDVAIAEKSARHGGVAKAAIVAFEDWAFAEQKLSRLYANIFPDNAPSLALVKACAWPLSEVDKGGVNFRGRDVDVVYTWMDADMLEETRRKRDFQVK